MMGDVVMALLLLVLLLSSAAAWDDKDEEEIIQPSEFDLTLDAKVMPTGPVPSNIINLYDASSKLVTLKRSINVRVPPMPAAGRPAAEVLTLSIGRYDTFDDIILRISDQLGVAEGDEAWRLVWPESGDTIFLRDLGWLNDNVTVELVPGGPEDTTAPAKVHHSVTVFCNGDSRNGVNYRLRRHDTCASIIEATGRAVGIDEAHMADTPSLFDEAGLRVTDNDLGWLPNNARLFIVPKHRWVTGGVVHVKELRAA
jgi:hypothetical protein